MNHFISDIYNREEKSPAAQQEGGGLSTPGDGT
jgi:hypothetical protein